MATEKITTLDEAMAEYDEEQRKLYEAEDARLREHYAQFLDRIATQPTEPTPRPESTMNKSRRKQLEVLRDQINELMGKAVDLRQEIETLKDEEQETFDNMPESLQATEKGCAMEEAVGRLEDAMTELDSVENSFNDCAAILEDVIGS